MKKLGVTIALLLIACQAFSNDTRATVAGGKITYQKSDDISIEKEILNISVDQIQVSYWFKNHTNQEISTYVAFPLPPAPFQIGDTYRVFAEWDESFYVYNKTDKNQNAVSTGRLKKQAAFINFKRTVNGKEQSYEHKIQAIDSKGNDITDLLKKHQIPLSSLYLTGYMDESLLEKNPDLKQKLKTLHLLTPEGLPNWQTQVTYFWHEKFPPNSVTKVTHTYRPHAGSQWIARDASSGKLRIEYRSPFISDKKENKLLSTFCPSAADQKKIEALVAKSSKENFANPLFAREVQYILSTGANWKGPIKDFRLEITPPAANSLTLFCLEHYKVVKDNKGVSVVEIKDFKPVSELNILFVNP